MSNFPIKVHDHWQTSRSLEVDSFKGFVIDVASKASSPLLLLGGWGEKIEKLFCVRTFRSARIGGHAVRCGVYFGGVNTSLMFQK